MFLTPIENLTISYLLNMHQNWVIFGFALCISGFIYPLRELYAESKLRKRIEQVDFTAWISFLPSDLKEEISPNP